MTVSAIIAYLNCTSLLRNAKIYPMESFAQPIPNHRFDIDTMAANFKKVTKPEDRVDDSIFETLEDNLEAAGFKLADSQTVHNILNDNSLFCRSENFGQVLDLVFHHNPINLSNKYSQANMCTMSSTNGYRVAMAEGFSGKDVGGVVKVVISFTGSHIKNNGRVPTHDNLWRLKPQTAEVSIIGTGEITPEDVKLISFRFPAKLYPEDRLTNDELDMLSDEGIQFIVRHYTNKKATR